MTLPRISASALALVLSAAGIAGAQDGLAVIRGVRPTGQAPAANFTGPTKVGNMFQARAPARVYGGTVTFERGARTHWHVHPLGQTLVITAGTGRVQHWGGPIREVRPGDVVLIPPGVKHWHGASPEEVLTHVAIVERPEAGPSTVWMEAVSDAQYAPPVVPQAPAGGQPSRAQQLMGDIAPELARITDEVLFGQVWAGPQLSQRDRSLVTVSALIAMNRPDQLRSHLARARSNGLTQEEVIAAITQLAFYAGWPNAVSAVAIAREVFAGTEQPRE